MHKEKPTITQFMLNATCSRHCNSLAYF